MSKELNLETQQNLIDVITERPIPFTVGDKRYMLYHPSLGKVLLIQRELANVKGSFSDIITLCQKNRELCCKILAYSVLCNRRQYYNSQLINQIRDEFLVSLDLEDLVTLISLVKMLNETDELEKALGLRKDDETRMKISKSKEENGSSVVFGGRSMYGTFIDAACQRYGWTLEYLLWDVSFANVHFMMKDAINSVYLSEEERKRLHIRGRHEQFFDAGSKENQDAIRELLKD